MHSLFLQMPAMIIQTTVRRELQSMVHAIKSKWNWTVLILAATAINVRVSRLGRLSEM